MHLIYNPTLYKIPHPIQQRSKHTARHTVSDKIGMETRVTPTRTWVLEASDRDVLLNVPNNYTLSERRVRPERVQTHASHESGGP
jgi:hypothetical protein